MISVRRTDGLPQTSFRFHLTTDTLVLLAMCFPLTGALRTFTFKINARAERTDTPTRVLANGRGFLRHGRTPQRAITSPLHPVTSLPLSRLFCGCLFWFFDIFGLVFRTAYFEQCEIYKLLFLPAMMQPSVHTTFSLWSGVFFLVFRMAECFSGNSNNCFVRVGEVGNSIKCIWIHLANDISCAVDIRIQNRTFLWFVLSTEDSFPWKMIFQTIPFFVDRNRIFVDQTCLRSIRFLCFNDRNTRLCCNTGQYPEKSCVM